ncbi:MAG TPA: 5-methyltetrahydropteroyltriglutamate--homocysteine S-methyltransferase [Acidimicrobiales bacterium]|nr:5-methyltetrahydropteroyltriglutamate--homocysteine S-methyltransferase [Acidimicrobiales bacterium]
MARSTNLGMPRIGPRREMKRAIEAYWAGQADAAQLAEAGRLVRARNWRVQLEAGIEDIASNDFSLYDQVLDTSCLVGAVPARFGFAGGAVDLDGYFSLARGSSAGGRPVEPLEMTKWFDTNYHYLVPELGPETTFDLCSSKPVDEFREALGLGIVTRPVLVGPVSFLLLGKATVPGFRPLELLPRLLAVYAELLDRLAAAGASWVQIDEPCLATDLDDQARRALVVAYDGLTSGPSPNILLASYFGGLADNLELATSLAVAGLHVDLVRDPGQLPELLERLRPGAVLSAGVVDGRNVWRNHLRRTLELLGPAHERLADRLWLAPSCSLQHVPHDLAAETELPVELRGWLAFARQKLDEVVALSRALADGPAAAAEAFEASDRAVESRRRAEQIRRPAVRRRLDALSPADAVRSTARRERRAVQQEALPLPALPTTTIGSFPQTAEIRAARARHGSGELADEDYRRFCESEIEQVIRLQERLGLDVLVHGEPERNDMVQYFAERLDGFACSRDGWVQSYGTRYVRPPILYGDVSRPEPITVSWSRYAQSLTPRPVKGMLTGPVTILQWSFVRDDQGRAETCRQIALAVRDEVLDLEAAGIRIIQVDEPALREGLPLRGADRPGYLAWATACFRLATAAVAESTQIHTHMCYAEFGDIMDAVVALDVDVISIEAARSKMDIVEDLAAVDCGAEVGLGVYDIHSPTVPEVDEITHLIGRALTVLPADRLWVNPDCGLKTRGHDEVRASLANMVAAARRARLGVDRISSAAV